VLVVNLRLLSVSYNTAQTSRTNVLYTIVTMEEKASSGLWRLEVNNPQQSNLWQPLWKFEQEQCATYQELADNLNQINAPIQIRIVPDTDL